MSHLYALEFRLKNERERFLAKKSEQKAELRRVWIAQIEREIADERARLGVISDAIQTMSDDELLAALGA